MMRDEMFKELERRAREVMPSPARDEYDEVRMTVNASDVLRLIAVHKAAENYLYEAFHHPQCPWSPSRKECDCGATELGSALRDLD